MRVEPRIAGAVVLASLIFDPMPAGAQDRIPMEEFRAEFQRVERDHPAIAQALRQTVYGTATIDAYLRICIALGRPPAWCLAEAQRRREAEQCTATIVQNACLEQCPLVGENAIQDRDCCLERCEAKRRGEDPIPVCPAPDEEWAPELPLQDLPDWPPPISP